MPKFPVPFFIFWIATRKSVLPDKLFASPAPEFVSPVAPVGSANLTSHTGLRPVRGRDSRLRAFTHEGCCARTRVCGSGTGMVAESGILRDFETVPIPVFF